MANELKSITDVPVVESADGVNLLVNAGGSAAQVPANSVGAQADWNETDETSPAYVKNKPATSGVTVYEMNWDTSTFQTADGADIRYDQVVADMNKGQVLLLVDYDSAPTSQYTSSPPTGKAYFVVFNCYKMDTAEYITYYNNGFESMEMYEEYGNK